MRWLGRIPRALCSPITDLSTNTQRVIGWHAGRIVTRHQSLSRIERRWLPYRASRARVWWDRHRSTAQSDHCELFFHHPLGNSDFLVLGYVHSGPGTSLGTFYCATLVLDRIAQLKGSHAIVAELTNERLSDRLLKRWGWQRHCLQWRGRHYIKRFYGYYPELPEAWQERVAGG